MLRELVLPWCIQDTMLHCNAKYAK
uniref:Uncharacterized protein n=1 Tax=Arundo donax TaxID=35708 RepID=A0A0A9FR53_ARUDO